MKKILLNSVLASGLAFSVTPLTASAATKNLDFMCYNDGKECEILENTLKGFHAKNPDIKVNVKVVPYKFIRESLPVQLAAGKGPDLSYVTDLGGLSKYYLNIGKYVDSKRWESDFGNFLNWYRPQGDKNGIYGLHMSVTVTGAYVNKTLFEQAGVSMPSETATWDDWAAAARKVAKATGVPYPMAIDRSGHRIAGPAISHGAKLFDSSGKPILIDEGFTTFAKKFVGWHKDGTMAKNVWMGAGGSTYQDASKEFINGKLVYYYSGSWNINKMDSKVGDAFDWVVTGSPCGGAACSGMPGGAGVVAFKDTKHPEAAAKVMDYLSQTSVYSQMSGANRSIPASKSAGEKGVDYQNISPAASAALTQFTKHLAKISPVAFAYQGSSHNRAMYNVSAKRISQALLGEMSVEQAMKFAKEDIAKLK